MTDYTEFEIGLNHRGTEGYTVDLRFSHPDSEETRWLQGEQAILCPDFLQKLREYELDPFAYGKVLSDELFQESALKTEFTQAIASTESQNMTMRIRLLLGPGAAELHSIRWETLNNPINDELLFTGEHIIFSRYLGSTDWRPVRLRPRSDLRALVVVANPGNLTDYAPGGTSLAPVDVAGEIERAKQVFGENIPTDYLASDGKANINNIIMNLRDGYDILYLVAHGALLRGEPHIWLENEEGFVDVVSGREFVSHIRETKQRPRLVVLASCQSAGSGSSDDNGALSALGPRLAESGIPSVLAMQGNVTMETVSQFMPVFFEELQRDGQIDRAMAVGRGHIRQRPDWWIPILFMRLKSGRIWYEPGFGEDRKGFEKWPALVRSIKRGSCTPIIGPNLTQNFESPSDIAQKWSEKYNFPLSVEDRDNLPQVAQYLAINQDQQFPRDEIIDHLRMQIIERYNTNTGEDLSDAPLSELFAKVGSERRSQEPKDPYKILADLPFPIYVTTNLSNMLDEALTEVGKNPRVELCRWNEYLDTLPSIYDDDPDYRPDVQNPLVYHLFGHCDEPDSLVLTEDDYFDFLIGVTHNKDLIPSVVRRALADTALVFLGFQMEDWDFRVLFRSIMSQEGSSRRRRYAHVAAQIDPEETRILHPERARNYLETYFQGADISIFWGNAEDFVKELTANYK